MATETERRLTPTERLHDIAARMAERPAPAAAAPYFTVEQTKATGGATVYEWASHVPVCVEFPTATEAFAAAVGYAEALRDKFGPSAT
jgi:hypothetical protein